MPEFIELNVSPNIDSYTRKELINMDNVTRIVKGRNATYIYFQDQKQSIRVENTYEDIMGILKGISDSYRKENKCHKN